MITSILAILLTLASLAAGAPGTVLSRSSQVPKKTSSATASQKRPINSRSNSSPLQTYNSFNGDVHSIVYYPDWSTWKAMYKKNYSPSTDAKMKKSYIANVMFLIENSFLDFGFSQGVTASTG